MGERSRYPDDAEILQACQSPVVRVEVGVTGSKFLFGEDVAVLENGWKVRVYFDCGDYDYVDAVFAPDGRRWSYGPVMSPAEVSAGFLPFGCEVFNMVIPFPNREVP